MRKHCVWKRLHMCALWQITRLHPPRVSVIKCAIPPIFGYYNFHLQIIWAINISITSTYTIVKILFLNDFYLFSVLLYISTSIIARFYWILYPFLNILKCDVSRKTRSYDRFVLLRTAIESGSSPRTRRTPTPRPANRRGCLWTCQTWTSTRRITHK